jgi:hypothetical protein
MLRSNDYGEADLALSSAIGCKVFSLVEYLDFCDLAESLDLNDLMLLIDLILLIVLNDCKEDTSSDSLSFFGLLDRCII